MKLIWIIFSVDEQGATNEVMRLMMDVYNLAVKVEVAFNLQDSFCCFFVNVFAAKYQPLLLLGDWLKWLHLVFSAGLEKLKNFYETPDVDHVKILNQMV